MTRTVLLALGLALASATACAMPPAHVDEQSGGFRRVDVETFRKEREEGSFKVVVDVRSPEEYAGGHVPGAVNIPLDQLKARLSELEPHRADKIGVICQSGRRSLAASGTLVEAGFTGVVDIEGGTGAWIAAGQKVE